MPSLVAQINVLREGTPLCFCQTSKQRVLTHQGLQPFLSFPRSPVLSQLGAVVQLRFHPVHA